MTLERLLECYFLEPGTKTPPTFFSSAAEEITNNIIIHKDIGSSTARDAEKENTARRVSIKF